MTAGIIKRIFNDHWNSFYRKHNKNIRENVVKEVEKMLKCRDIRYGYIELRCEHCNESKKVGFTCKSRFCTSCGKIYTDKWVESMLGNLINVRHRHIVFTIPEELRKFFGEDRQRLKLLPKCAAKTITSWMHKINKSEEFTPGIVTVIHTFGRDLKWNPHVHMMVTEGGRGNKTEWRHIRHFPYEALRKRWQKILLDEITIESKNSVVIRNLKNKLYKEKSNGFYVHAKPEISSAKQAAQYVGRYVGRPAIAESRIIKYDGENVTYKYTRHEDGRCVIETILAEEFIKKLIIHIPEKQFKMVRYFGIYSRRGKEKCNFIMMLDKKVIAIKKLVQRWEYRILAAFGIDPCKCHKCNGKMKFYDIVYPRYGSMREHFKKKIRSEAKEKLKEIMEIYAVTKHIISC